jgi:hypothetical protein
VHVRRCPSRKSGVCEESLILDTDPECRYEFGRIMDEITTSTVGHPLREE